MKSTFYDHSQTWVWLWFSQALIYHNTSYFYDHNKKCYVRKVINVQGWISYDLNNGQEIFHPYKNDIVNYVQYLHN